MIFAYNLIIQEAEKKNDDKFDATWAKENADLN